MSQCFKCGKETKNPKYCSRSCAASCINHQKARRLRTNKCRTCDKLILSNRKYCSDCPSYNKILEDITLKEAIYLKHHRTCAYGLVRARAKIIVRNLNWKSCKLCGYDKHIEIAHIKSISSFSLDTKLSIINSIDNLIPLCPNCHWELDNLEVPSEGIEPSSTL